MSFLRILSFSFLLLFAFESWSQQSLNCGNVNLPSFEFKRDSAYSFQDSWMVKYGVLGPIKTSTSPMEIRLISQQGIGMFRVFLIRCEEKYLDLNIYTVDISKYTTKGWVYHGKAFNDSSKNVYSIKIPAGLTNGITPKEFLAKLSEKGIFKLPLQKSLVLPDTRNYSYTNPNMKGTALEIKVRNEFRNVFYTGTELQPGDENVEAFYAVTNYIQETMVNKKLLKP